MKVIKETTKKIPLFHPYISKKAAKAAYKTLQTKFIGQGPKLQEFEIAFGKKFKTKYAVSTNSCTSALHMAYVLAGVKQGDEVIGPLLTCSATWHPVLQLGAKPVFVDIDPYTLNVDAYDIEHRITKKTKAIVVMHYGGTVCDMDAIMRIARKHKLKVIEDCAQSVGATYKGKPVGTIGDYGCFSFQAIKQMTTIDGGMLTVKNKADYEKAKRIRWFGIDRDLKIEKGWRQFKNWERREITYDVWEVGYKYHTTDVNAAIGLEHLKELPGILKRYKALYKAYSVGLRGVQGIYLMGKVPGDVQWLATVMIDEGERDNVAKALEKEGVETNLVHIRSDVYTVFKPYTKKGSYPMMDMVEGDYLCLPLHLKLTEKDIKKICHIVSKVLKKQQTN